MSTELNNTNENQLKSFKDIKSLEELDFDKIDLKRGDTPLDIKEKCLQLCKDYLSGNWCQQTVDTIEVRRITGGMLNQLYYCGINEPDISEKVPQEVGVRLYGHNVFEYRDKGRIRDVVVALAFSLNNLGPKIYGLFEGGQILKFYKHRIFQYEEQQNPKIVKQVFQTLAKIHSMDVPIRKDGNFLYELLIKTLGEVFEKKPINDYIKEFDCKTLNETKIRAEIDWIKGVIESANSPVVFTHNDFRSSNLLITEPNDELIVCDFDITQYGYRGSDFVSNVKEWGQKKFELKELKDLPVSDPEIMAMIEIYVEECERIYGKTYSENAVNSVEHILKEVKIFLMFSYLFGTVYILSYDENDKDMPINTKLSMQISDLAFKNYFTVKTILKDQNIINY